MCGSEGTTLETAILQRVLVGKPKAEKQRLEDLGVDGMTILTLWRRIFFFILAHPVHKM